MISLRKHMDELEKRKAAPVPTAGQALRYGKGHADPAVSAYSRVLRAVSESGQRAVPGMGEELGKSFREIQQSLAGLPVSTLYSATERVETELSRWADRAWQRHADNEREIKEIIGVVARASESLVERDRRYGAQIGDLNKRLCGLAELDDLPVIRRTILDSTRALRECIEKMVEEGRESQRRMGSEVAEYKERLAESERISRTDLLTKLANRRAFEEELEIRIVIGQKFCLILMDLNDFKGVNDTWGHAAGDDLLRQFAGELRFQFTSADLVARWGGDEFVAIVAGNGAEAASRAERIRRWVLGDYKTDAGSEIEGGGQKVRISVDASLGAVEWNGSESGADLLARADNLVYAGKRLERRRGDRRAIQQERSFS
jgi:diguanylate cyclase